MSYIRWRPINILTYICSLYRYQILLWRKKKSILQDLGNFASALKVVTLCIFIMSFNSMPSFLLHQVSLKSLVFWIRQEERN